MYELWLAIHLVCAVLWVGGSVTLHALGRMTARSESAQERLDFNRRSLKLANALFAPLSVVLIIAGVLLVEEVGYKYSELWITLGFVGWIFSLIVGVAFYPREGRRIDRAAAESGPDAPAVLDGTRRILLVNSIEVTILVLVVVNMAVKPG